MKKGHGPKFNQTNNIIIAQNSARLPKEIINQEDEGCKGPTQIYEKK